MIVEVESSIVLKNGCISVLLLPPSVSSMYRIVADVRFALLNLSVPAPGSESAVFVENVYSKDAPPKLPFTPCAP